MKLRDKIFLYSFVLFTTVFCISSTFQIENNLKSTLEKLIRDSASEQQSITSGLFSYVIISEKRNIGREIEPITDYIKEYLNSRINSEGVYTELLDEEGQIIYSNLDFEIPEQKDRIEIENAMTTQQYVIRDIKEKTYLSITSLIKIKEEKLINSYILDISAVYKERERQYSFFFWVLAIVCIIMAIGIYLLSNHITKSIYYLTETIQKMASGNYKERVPIISKDEIGSLAKNYNLMANSIQEKVEQLQEKAEAQQRFIDNFTHELRTPLTAIVGYADYLRSIQTDDTTQEIAQRIFSEGKRIEKLSEIMMDLVFIKHSSFTLVRKNLYEILKKAANAINPVMMSKNITLHIDCQKQNLWIDAEENLIVNLFCNLLDNAVKASSDGSNIYIKALKQKDSIQVEIKDQGKGIPAEEVKRVFEKFYMVDKVRNNKNCGVGLGLSICLDIAKIHHATLELDSKEGEGTIVRIIFLNNPYYDNI